MRNEGIAGFGMWISDLKTTVIRDYFKYLFSF